MAASEAVCLTAHGVEAIEACEVDVEFAVRHPRSSLSGSRGSDVHFLIRPDISVDMLAGALDEIDGNNDRNVYWAGKRQTWFGSMPRPQSRCTPTVLAVSRGAVSVVTVPFVSKWPGRFTPYDQPIFGPDYRGVAQSDGCSGGQSVPALAPCEMLFVYASPSTSALTLAQSATDIAEGLGLSQIVVRRGWSDATSAACPSH